MSIKTIDDLQPDPQNPRRRTDRSSSMLVESLQTVGAARSIVIDENGRILAGNGTVEAAKKIGLENIVVVDADGQTIIAVRRSGLTEEQKKQLSLYDNRTSDLSEWDPEILQALNEFGEIELKSFWEKEELEPLIGSLNAANTRNEGRLIEPPEDFKEYDEDIETEYCCPKCGYRWSGKPNSDSDSDEA